MSVALPVYTAEYTVVPTLSQAQRGTMTTKHNIFEKCIEFYMFTLVFGN